MIENGRFPQDAEAYQGILSKNTVLIVDKATDGKLLAEVDVFLSEDSGRNYRQLYVSHYSEGELGAWVDFIDQHDGRTKFIIGELYEERGLIVLDGKLLKRLKTVPDGSYSICYLSEKPHNSPIQI